MNHSLRSNIESNKQFYENLKDSEEELVCYISTQNLTSYIMDASPRPPSDGSPPPALPQKYTGSPTDFLKGVVGKRVIVRLTSGVDYQGSNSDFFPAYSKF